MKRSIFSVIPAYIGVPMRSRTGTQLASRASKCAVAAILTLLVSMAAQAATWEVLRSPNSTPFDNVLWGADAFSSSRAWAVGYADTGTLPTRRPIIERWNGRKWTLVTIPLPAGGGELRDVDATSASIAWAVGFANTDIGSDTLTQQWSGSGWTIVPSPNRSAQNYLLAVKAFGASDVWAVGSNNIPNSLNFETLVLRWDGVSWEIVPSSNPDPFENHLLAMDGVASDDLWAVGYTQGGQDAVRVPLAMHWDGSAWTSTPIPAERDASLEGVVALAPDDVWAVGWTFSLQLLWQVPYALHWNGTSWTKMSIPQSSPQGGRLFDVTALSPTQVYVVGHTNESGVPTLVMKWDGTDWTIEDSPNPSGVRSLWDATTFGANDLLFVGSSARIINGNIGPARTLIVRATD